MVLAPSHPALHGSLHVCVSSNSSHCLPTSLPIPAGYDTRDSENRAPWKLRVPLDGWDLPKAEHQRAMWILGTAGRVLEQSVSLGLSQGWAGRNVDGHHGTDAQRELQKEPPVEAVWTTLMAWDSTLGWY